MDLNSDFFHKIRNELTEYSKYYKNVNSYLCLCYNGLPSYLSKLSHVLFWKILKNKMYGKFACDNENKRIYTNINVTVEDILVDCNPSKYLNDNELATDVSNMLKRIKEIDELNIFYCWKYRRSCVYIMEREFGCWRFYNAKGCVIPKTLKKIIVLSNDILECIMKFEKEANSVIDKDDIGKSFCKFIERMIGKMNLEVKIKLPVYNENDKDYLKKVSIALNQVKDFEGLGHDENFLDKLPIMVSKKLRDIMKKQSKTDEIIPKNPNLVKGQHIGHKKVKVETEIDISREPSKPKLFTYGGNTNPFKDSRAFVKYYRMYLQQCSEDKVHFDVYDADTIYAAQIIDKLIESKRDDKAFLDSWLRYFFDNKLKGLKIKKEKYTMMKVFKDTFEDFSQRYYEPI